MSIILFSPHQHRALYPRPERRGFTAQRVVGRVDNRNLKRAYYVYHLEFRQYPEPYLGFDNAKRVWINITNDSLETIFEGWPEDVLATAQAKIDEQEQDELEDQSSEDTQRQDD